jgi:DHA1 family multidrug/chloramphenicol efflux transport protein-like MFS transporter
VASNVFIVYLVLFEFTVYMANDLIMPGMLNVVREFSSVDAFIPLSLSLYLLGGMVLQFLMGPISDKVGRRPTMIAGCAFFIVCTVLIILSSSMQFFLIARFFQGMGLCFIGVCGYATVQELFEEKKAVRVIALMTTTSVTAPILGPILGGLFIQSFNWRWIFASTLVCSHLSLWGLWKYMPETVKTVGAPLPKRKISFKFKKTKIISFKPMLQSYKEALSDSTLVLGGFLSGFLAVPIICWIAISPIVLFENAKISPNLYGAVQVPIFGFYILGNFALRKLTYKYSLKEIIQIATPICLVALVILCFCSYFYSTSYWSLVLPLSLFCLGDGILSAPIARLSLYSSDRGKGVASAVHGLIS